MTLELGIAPEKLLVYLAYDADFDQTIVNLDANDQEIPWDPGDELHLTFGDSFDWIAQITGSEATWHIPALDVNELLATGPITVALRYINGAASRLWAFGTVRRPE